MTEFTAGKTLRITVPVTDGDGNVVNLTGVQAIVYQLIPRRGTAFAIEKTLGDGIAVTDAAGGIFKITLSPADTAPLASGGYDHVCELTDADGDTDDVFREPATVKRNLIT